MDHMEDLQVASDWRAQLLGSTWHSLTRTRDAEYLWQCKLLSIGQTLTPQALKAIP